MADKRTQKKKDESFDCSNLEAELWDKPDEGIEAPIKKIPADAYNTLSPYSRPEYTWM